MSFARCSVRRRNGVKSCIIKTTCPLSSGADKTCGKPAQPNLKYKKESRFLRPL